MWGWNSLDPVNEVCEGGRALYDESLLIACYEDKMREEKHSAAQQDTRDVLDIYV